jgi:hypothetical protein
MRCVRWTEQEDLLLEAYWNDASKGTLMKMLPGRTCRAIYERARKYLKLQSGAPPGMVAISVLAKDPSWGYGEDMTRRIIEAGKVRVRNLNYSSKRHSTKGVSYVNREEITLAAAAYAKAMNAPYVGKERVWDAARRLRVPWPALRGWLTQEGLLPPPGTVGRSCPFWAEPEVYNRVVAKYRITRPMARELQQATL